MNIEISLKSDGTFIADCSDLHGSPPLGFGETKNEALGSLITKMSKEIIGNTGVTWLQKYFGMDINFKESVRPTPEVEHQELWDNVVAYAENW